MENSLPNWVNEIEPNDDSETILRTLVNFELVTEEGISVSLDDISTIGCKVIAKGNVVAPLPLNWRSEILNLSCTCLQEAPKSMDDFASHVVTATPSLLNKRKSTELVNENQDGNKILDRDNIHVGLLLDGYCNQTFKWYEARITDIKNDKLRVHFLGWNAKHDEWLDRSSERIATLGSAMSIMMEEAKRVESLIPWDQPMNIYDKVSKTLGEDLPEKKQVEVIIDGIEDYAIDYTYANPTVWIIAANSGIWYRVAGLLCPGGINGSPKQSYKSTFNLSVDKFFMSAHVVMCLLDFLPSNPRMTLESVIMEVKCRTENKVEEKNILQNYEFLVDQVCSLEKPIDWHKSIKFETCLFIQQLKKQGKLYIHTDGKQGMMIIKLTEEEKKNKKLLEKEKLKVVDKSSESIPGPKIKYPIDDGKLLEMEQAKGNFIMRPDPSSNSKQLQFINTAYMGNLLEIWNTITNFKSYLGIPYISIEFFESCLLETDDIDSNNFMITEIHLSLLTKVIEDRVKNNIQTKIKSNPESNSYNDNEEVITNSLLYMDTNKFINDASSSPSSFVDLNHPSSIIDSSLRLGNSWVEAVRILIAEKYNTILYDYSDYIGEFINIIEVLLKELDSSSNILFGNHSHLSNSKIDIENIIPSDYWLINGQKMIPIDLETILKRIKLGWYDEDYVINNNNEIEKMIISNDNNDRTIKNIKKFDQLDENDNIIALNKFKFSVNSFVVGDMIDVYNIEFQTWYDAIIISINLIDNTITIHYNYWGDNKFDETIDSTSNRIALFGSISGLGSTRFLIPDIVNSSINIDISNSNEMNVDYNINSNVNANSKYGGYKTIASDIRSIFTHCIEYFERKEKIDDNILLENAHHLIELFEKLYSKRIVKSDEESRNTRSLYLDKLKKSNKKKFSYDDWKSIRNKSINCEVELTDETKENINNNYYYLKEEALDWSDITDCLGCIEYVIIPLEMKLQIFNFLIEEILCTSSCRDYIDELTEIKKKYDVDKMNKERILNKQHNVEEVTVGSNIRLSINGDDKNKKLKNTENEIESNNILNEIFEYDKVKFEDLSTLYTRLKPLGKDRNGSIYWIFPRDNYYFYNKNRLFVELKDNSNKWCIYSNNEDIKKLYEWLNDKGINELHLRRKYLKWMDEYDVNKVIESKSQSSKKRKSEKLSDINDNYIVDDNNNNNNKHKQINENYLQHWQTNKQQDTVLLSVSIDLPRYLSLGIGVKEFQGCIVVTSFKSVPDRNNIKNSAGKISGLRIGDQLWCSNGSLFTKISDLQQKIKFVNEKASVLDILVIRNINYSSCFNENLSKDKEIILNLNQQNEDDIINSNIFASISVGISSLSEYQNIIKCPHQEQFRDLPCNLIGSLLAFIQYTLHPYITTEEWVNITCNKWLNQLQILLTSIIFTNGINISIENNKLEELRYILSSLLLDFESNLNVAKNSLNSNWILNRNRNKWRRSCYLSSNFSQLSVCLTLLINSSRIEEVKPFCNPISRKNYYENYPNVSKNLIPTEGSTVIYYGSSYIESINTDKEDQNISELNILKSGICNISNYQPMWGHTKIPIANEVKVS
jgi:hypothetical protein